MRILRNILIVALFFLFTAPSTADIKHAKFRSDDEVGTTLIEEFGFTRTGYISVAISSVSVTSVPVTTNVSQPDLSRLGFYLLSDKAKDDFDDELERNPTLCVLDSKFMMLLFTFKDLPPSQSSFNKSHLVTYPNHYALYFANCNPLTHATMDIRIELYNTNGGTTKNYLSVGQTQLPSLYFTFFIIYLCISGLWVLRWFMKYRSFHRIHLLMCVFIATKALSLFFASEVKQHVKVTGFPPGWVVLFYIFQFMGDVIWYTLYVLIGLPFVKPFYEELKKMIMLTVIPLHVFPDLVLVAISHTGRRFIEDSDYRIGGLMVAVAFCCFAIIIPLLCSVLEASAETATNTEMLITVEIFFVCFSLYAIVGRLVVTSLLFGFLPYQYRWVCYAGEEIQGLLIYIIVMLFLIGDEDEDDRNAESGV